MTAQQGRIVFEESRRLPRLYHLGDDPRLLQTAFGALFDEAANAVFLAGLDLDEVLTDRFLIINAGDEVYQLPATFLADTARLQATVLKGLPPGRRSANLAIGTVKIIVRQDPLAS